MKINNTKTISSDRLKGLIYAKSGVGKTTLAKTLPGKTLIASAEAGLLSLAGSDIDVVDITTDDEGKVIPRTERMARLLELYNYLGTPEVQAKYDNLYVDSLSEVLQNLVEQLFEGVERKDTIAVWGDYTKKARSLIKSFRDLPGYNVFFTALEKTDKDDNNRRFLVPNVPGSRIIDDLPGFFDEVFWLHIDEHGERKILTSPRDNVNAKDRSGRLEHIEPADLGVIVKKIRNHERRK